MTITLKKLGASRTQATVTFEEQPVREAEESALKALGADLRIPGFRPGHASLSLLREHISPERLHEETVHLLLPRAMEELQKKGVKPIVTPRVALQSLSPFTLTITLVEKPEAKVNVKRVQTGFLEKQKRESKETKGTKETKEKEGAEESALLDLLAEETQVDLAEELVDDEVRILLEQHARKVEQAGMTLATWLASEQKKPEAFLQELRPIASKRLRARLGISALIEEWKISVSEEEVQTALTQLLAPLPPEQQSAIRAHYAKGSRAYTQLQSQKMVEKVILRLRGG